MYIYIKGILRMNIKDVEIEQKIYPNLIIKYILSPI